MKVLNFTDLDAWNVSHIFVLDIYKITKEFPKEEIYRLVDQMCRAALSITSNIAEGFGRHTGKDKIRFYSISLGSLYEVQNQLILAKDLGYVNQECFDKLNRHVIRISKLINGLIKTSQNRVF